MYMATVLHDHKSHVASPFDCHDVRNAVVPLTMMMSSCHANISVKGMPRSEMSHCTWFQSSCPNKYHGSIDNTISITCYLCQCQRKVMTKKSCCTSLQLFWHKKWSHFICLLLRNKMLFSMPLACDTNTGANGITCTKSHFSPHFEHCDLINAMVPLTTVLSSKDMSRYYLDII